MSTDHLIGFIVIRTKTHWLILMDFRSHSNNALSQQTQKSLHWCRCQNVKVKFQQRDIERDMWETVEPGDSIDYAWEEPNMAHRLCVVMEADSVRDNSEHEYNLDVIKVHPQHVIDPASLYTHMNCRRWCAWMSLFLRLRILQSFAGGDGRSDAECWSGSPCRVSRSWYTIEEHSKTTPKTFKLGLILKYFLCKTHNP